MLRCIFDCIATGSMILGVGGIAGVIEFGTSPVPCVIAISIGIGSGMLSNWIGKTWYIGEKKDVTKIIAPLLWRASELLKNNTWYAIPVFILRQGKGKVNKL